MVEFGKDELPDVEAKAEAAEKRKTEVLRKGRTRAQAIEVGRLLGEEEAERRRETGLDREGRMKRAMAYAAWEFDGKPLGRGAEYRQEFGIAEPAVVGSLERALSPRILKK